MLWYAPVARNCNMQRIIISSRESVIGWLKCVANMHAFVCVSVCMCICAGVCMCFVSLHVHCECIMQHHAGHKWFFLSQICIICTFCKCQQDLEVSAVQRWTQYKDGTWGSTSRTNELYTS